MAAKPAAIISWVSGLSGPDLPAIALIIQDSCLTPWPQPSESPLAKGGLQGVRIGGHPGKKGWQESATDWGALSSSRDGTWQRLDLER